MGGAVPGLTHAGAGGNEQCPPSSGHTLETGPDLKAAAASAGRSSQPSHAPPPLSPGPVGCDRDEMDDARLLRIPAFAFPCIALLAERQSAGRLPDREGDTYLRLAQRAGSPEHEATCLCLHKRIGLDWTTHLTSRRRSGRPPPNP